jgi:glycosyltransferase involved in cell wall biosynthesis
MSETKRIAMFVFNNCKNDARVLKEAGSLTRAGYDVEIIAMLDKQTIPLEERDGFVIRRLKLNPIHLRIIRFFGNPFRRIFGFLIPDQKEVEVVEESTGGIMAWFRRGLEKRDETFKKVLSNRLKIELPEERLLHKDNIKVMRMKAGRSFFTAIGFTLLAILYAPFRLILMLPQLTYTIITKIIFRVLPRIVRVLIQYPLKRILLPFHKYFTYHNFYQLAVRHCYAPFRLILMLPQLTYTIITKIIFRVLPRIVRVLIQYPLKRILLPFHKYFTYHNFYQLAVRHCSSNPRDVYHCHDLNTLKVGMTLKQKLGTYLVYDSHELYRHKNRLKPAGAFKKWYLARLERKGARMSDAIITVGYCISEWLAEEYKVKEPYVIYNAPAPQSHFERDPEKDLRKALQIPAEDFLLVYSGAITFNRGLEQVLEAAAHVPDLQMVLMGYGSDAYKEKLQKIIDKGNAGDCIRFFGPVPHQDVSQYLSSADCGIAPIINICLSYYFCAPNKLFEFVHAGLPVLASNFPEMSRVVEEYDLGFTFDPEDPENIQEVIRNMMASPEKRAHFKGNTQAAADNYNWAMEEAKLVELYQKLA